MWMPTLQDILARVEKPSRYLGSEINSVHKKSSDVLLSVALAFPDLYEIGTSHFGLQILYHILNSDPRIAAERVFAPGNDMYEQLQSAGLPLFSLESHRPLNEFEIVGFSLLYELNYTNVIHMLRMAAIPLFTKERGENDPLIVAGGPCTCNPEPMADFFDAMVIGDGEQLFIKMCHIWLVWRRSESKSKRSLLEQWARLEGVYVPSMFEVAYDSKGTQLLRPKSKYPLPIKRAVVKDLDQTVFPVKSVIPFGRPIHDRLRLEVARGCTRGCRFCQAGMIYRPVRERSPQRLLQIARDALAATGYEDLSLLSLSTGDYSCISELLTCLMQEFQALPVAVSLPSFRAGSLGSELMQLIQRVRKTGFTIAPEAGSQRLRDVINKNISEADVFQTVQTAFNLGWRVIKLYFMIGLPSERPEDLEAIVDLVQRLRKVHGPKGRKGKLNVSVTTFIPKAHTPFQWEPQAALEESEIKIDWLKQKLRISGVQFKWQDPRVSLLEGILARGDRRLAPVIVSAHTLGCRFDGWSDQFRFDLWQQAFANSDVDINDIAYRRRDLDDNLPWEHVHIGVSKAYLQSEYHAAHKRRLTGDCRFDGCSKCGVCDFKTLAPKLFRNFQVPGDTLLREEAGGHAQTFLFVYSKTGKARYFGHLEMANLFIRAFRRARINVVYSKGFHPMPRISFDNPLPMGMQSLHEIATVKVLGTLEPQWMMDAINANLPIGLKVKQCRKVYKKKPLAGDRICDYIVKTKAAIFDTGRFSTSFQIGSQLVTVSKPNRPSRQIDLKDVLKKVECIDLKTVKLTVQEGRGGLLRPAVIIERFFDLPQETVRQLNIIKIKQKVLNG